MPQSYEGEFADGLMHGQGTYYFADGCVYQGEYAEGKRNGRGVYRFLDGSFFEGEYRDGVVRSRMQPRPLPIHCLPTALPAPPPCLLADVPHRVCVRLPGGRAGHFHLCGRLGRGWPVGGRPTRGRGHPIQPRS